MNITLNKLSALKALRFLRSKGIDVARLPRVSLSVPDASPRTRWTKSILSFESLGLASPTEASPLQVAVPSEGSRIRARSVSNTIYEKSLPETSFLSVGDGVSISSPEMLFVELGQELHPVAHLLLGLELCGTYEAGGSFGRFPATSADRIKRFVEEASPIAGVKQTRRVSRMLVDNAWSPMEAVLAALIMLPASDMGYGLGKVVLNKRVEVGAPAGAPQSRVPDIMVEGSSVGINYDGSGHLELERIVSAAMRAALDPASGDVTTAIDEALAKVRAKYVDDRRRDRDLLAEGLTVFTAVKEDLYERGALDRLMLQLISALEVETGKTYPKTHAALKSRGLSSMRQKHIWALLPGTTGERARAELAASKAARDLVVRDVWLERGLSGAIEIVNESEGLIRIPAEKH